MARLVAAAAIAGTGTLGRGVAILLYARDHTSSFTAAGLVLAAFTAGALVSGPLRGRQLDRRGFSVALLPLGILSAAFSASIVLAGELDAPAAVLGALAGASGATAPPVGPALRSLWAKLLGGSGQLPAAYALTTMLNEISFFAGPLLAGLLVAVASPAVALIALSGTVLVGTVSFATSPAAREVGVAAQRLRTSPLRAAGVRTVLVTATAFGAVFGVLDVALPAFAVEEGSAGTGGLLLAALSPGIFIGSYFYGRLAIDKPPGRLYSLLSLVAALGIAPLVLAGSLPVLLGLTVLAGFAFAPITTCQWALIDVVAPSGTGVETTSWVNTVYLGGGVAGSALGGLIAEHGSATSAFYVAGGAAVAAAAVAAAWRSTLEAPRGE